jgi:hypothetical protein
MNMDVNDIKAVADGIIADLKASSFRTKELTVQTKDGLGYLIEVEEDNISTSNAGLVFKGKEQTIRKKKSTSTIKETVFIPWSEVTKLQALESTMPVGV